jgi:hypothetical protein
MIRSRSAATLLAMTLCAVGLGLTGARPARAALAGQADRDDVPIRALLQRVEQAAQRVDAAAYLALLGDSADRTGATEFTTAEFRRGITRVVIEERDRRNLAGALQGRGYTLTVDAFFEYGDRARVATWELAVQRVDTGDWRIASQSLLSAVENIYRLSVTRAREFDARNFVVTAEDLELTLVEGTVFTVDTDQGTTGLVLLGRGEMRFHPAPRTEMEQVRIFGGNDTLESRFDAAFVRVGTLEAHADRSALTERAVDSRDLRRAERVFREESVKSFAVDLADLTRDQWSLLPGAGDFLAEIRTRRFETLTYVRSASEPEDISFFERRRSRNIAVYASKSKLASRGRFFNEDEQSPFDVLDYNIDVTSAPDRQWIDGRATLHLRVRTPGLAQLTIRLADSLVVRSIVSDRFGRLFNLRVTNQNTILVNLPTALIEGAEMVLRIDYSGRLEPQPANRETLAMAQRDQGGSPEVDDPSGLKPEANYLYSNQSYWYPQPTISDYATATIQITVPAAYTCVASGEPSSDSPRVVPGREPSQTQKVYSFTTDRPLRYLAFLVSRLTRADRWTVVFDKGASGAGPAKDAPALSGAVYDKLDLIVEANPRLVSGGRNTAERAVDVIQFYESLVGDSAYSTFTLALVESVLPGGHSPGYFAVLNHPMPNSNVTWRNDPAAFSNYPEFFLAHEIAHQWWGQAVGWRNYHEQWLSEGFAQYFAALYAQHARGQDAFGGVMRQMRRWAIDKSDQGPVYLGYRVGHVKNDGRAFRAIVYNKGGAVLHMLRQLIGDDAFFKGLRRFYAESRFVKVGTHDFRLAMESESGQSLERFFERWVYNSTLPALTFGYRIEPSALGQDVVLHFEQAAEVFDVPVTVTLRFTDGKAVDVLVPVTDRVVDFRVPLERSLRAAEISRDSAGLADVLKN